MHGVLPPELQCATARPTLAEFNRAMRESAVATLERVIATNRSPAIGRILDFGASQASGALCASAIRRDAMTLFTALTSSPG